jgi:hypothetical protein
MCAFAEEFERYINYVRQLRFDQEPDYAYCRQLFRDLFTKNGFVYDYVYDWNVMPVSAVCYQNHRGPMQQCMA